MMMTEVLQPKQAYLDAFARHEKETLAATRPALRRLHKAAIARFAEIGFPTQRDEEWRFTNIAPLVKTPFALATPGECFGLTRDKVSALAPATGEAAVLVIVNGQYVPDLSSLDGLPAGVVVDGLAHALATHAEAIEPHLGRYAKFDHHAFAALNTAFFRDGAFVRLPAGAIVDRPIHLLHVAASSGEHIVGHPRTLVLAERGCQATIIESYVGTEGEVAFTNAVTEIVVGEGAIVGHYKVQRESRTAFHMASTQLQVARGANFNSNAVTLGGAVVRNDITAVFEAEGSECTLNGLYLADGDRLIDNHTNIDHAKAHCNSHELYKGVLAGKGKGVFNGKIFVRQDAQKTDAKQTNQTLLLSEDAVINTKPQLEIFADDVKCTHGATVGQLDEEAVFYLRSRGLALAEARALLTFAFANDIISRITVAPLREELERYLLAAQHLPAGQ